MNYPDVAGLDYPVEGRALFGPEKRRTGTRLVGRSSPKTCHRQFFTKKSPILLLDEATSALDIETENTILKNIRNLKPLRTCVAITHRPTVSDYCAYPCRLLEGVLYVIKE